MKYLIYVLFWLPLFCYADRRTITIASSVTVESVDSVDLAASGKWFVQFVQDDWVKLKCTLYPDESDRTQPVIDAQNAFKAACDTYVTLALDGRFYSADSKGSGIIISAGSFNYIAVSFEDGVSFKLYVRNANKQQTIPLYPDLNDETRAATDARADMATNLAIISAAAKAGNFFTH